MASLGFHMKPIVWLVVACIIVLPLFLVSCVPESTPTPPVDVQQLSSKDVISIAQEHSVNSPLNAIEEQIGTRATSTDIGWHSDYVGNGKWIVELHIGSEENIETVYRWTVIETDLKALFLGAYKGSLIEYKLKYGHYPE